MKRLMFISLSVATLVGATGERARAQVTAGSAWIHIRVEEPARESKVHVNLPLSVVQVALEAAPDKVVSKGRIHLGHEGHDLSLADMRRLWKELKTAGDAQLVTMENGDEKVNVARKGDLVQVRLERPKEKETVAVDVPVALVDALFSGEGEGLDVVAAVKELQSLRGDVVRVDDQDSRVRIWIDEKN